MAGRVTVIGAGPGGLATAMLLAHGGADVTILEKADRPGGRTAAIEEGGFRFDTGPTFFLYPQVLRDIFKTVGRDFDKEVPMIRLDPQYRLVFGAGGELSATPDPVRMKQAIAALCSKDAPGFDRFMTDNRDKLRRFKPILESPFNSWRDLLNPALFDAVPALHPLRSVDSDLSRYFSDDRIRLSFSFQSKYLGMSPFRCPSLFTILSFLEYEYGVWHPIGGCAAVIEAMARVARELGVKIRHSTPVEEILFEGKQAVGVRTVEGDHAADAVVVNADFAHAMHKLVPDRLRRRWTDARIAKKKYSCSTFMMYLGIEGKYDPLAHHTIYLTKDYKTNLRQIEDEKVVPTDPSFYVQNACVTDPSLAPSGMSTLYVLAPVPHRSPNIDWAAEAPAFRKLLLERMKRIGIEGVERRIRYEKVVTPGGWESDYAVYRGATFNLAHGLDQMLQNRPHNRFEDLRSVYLVGGGTHPGSGLPVIFESAKISSRLLLDDLGLRRQRPRHARPSSLGIGPVALGSH